MIRTGARWFAALALSMGIASTGTTVQAEVWPKHVVGSDGGIMSKVVSYAGEGLPGYQDGSSKHALFFAPQGLTMTADGNLLVVDSRNHLIRQITKDGQVSVFAGSVIGEDAFGYRMGGWYDATRTEAVFDLPHAIAIDTVGTMYIADTANHLIRTISIDGKTATLAGSGLLGSKDGTGEDASFYRPQGIAVAQDGTVYVADTLNHVIRRIDEDGRVTTIGAPAQRTVEVVDGSVEWAGDYRDGSTDQALFNEPTALIVDKQGNLYVSDTGNHLIRYINLQANTVTTVAGVFSGYAEHALYATGGFIDGPALEASLSTPRGLALTPEGGVVIADTQNHAIRYLVNGELMTLAGNGQPGSAEGLNGTAVFDHPSAVTLIDGDILVADRDNQQIRRLSLFALPDSVTSGGEMQLVVDQNEVTANIKVVQDRAMVPVRALGAYVDYSVYLDTDDQTLVIHSTEHEIRITQDGVWEKLTISSGEQTSSGHLDVEPYLSEDGHYYLPIRFMAEVMGYDLEWLTAYKTIVLRELTSVTDKP